MLTQPGAFSGPDGHDAVGVGEVATPTRAVGVVTATSITAGDTVTASPMARKAVAWAVMRVGESTESNTATPPRRPPSALDGLPPKLTAMSAAVAVESVSVATDDPLT